MKTQEIEAKSQELANLLVTERVAPNGDVIVKAEADWPAGGRYSVTSREWETTEGDVADRTAYHRQRAIASLSAAVAKEAARLAAKSEAQPAQGGAE